jgi:hypothetical protein
VHSAPTSVRIAAGIGLVFGLMSVVAGTRVLAGLAHPDYVVLPWLVAYNVAAGAVGVAAGAGLWGLWNWASRLTRLLAAAHGVVLAVLMVLWVTDRHVARDSLMAMLLRVVVWTAIAAVVTRARTASRG